IYAPSHIVTPEMQSLVKNTRAMLASLKAAGVKVGITNPAGLLWHRLPARDHRKFVLIDDDIAYIGGINISDHNFRWHDLMLRIDDAGVAALLRSDFEATWRG